VTAGISKVITNALALVLVINQRNQSNSEAGEKKG
jgi:hypothetical protein